MCTQVAHRSIAVSSIDRYKRRHKDRRKAGTPHPDIISCIHLPSRKMALIRTKASKQRQVCKFMLKRQVYPTLLYFAYNN